MIMIMIIIIMKGGRAVTCEKCYTVFIFSQESKTEFIFILCFV